MTNLHNSESGVCEARLGGGAWAMAGELARYIADPSTVRVRVLEQHGWAPSREAVARLIEGHARRRALFRDALGEPIDAAQVRESEARRRREALAARKAVGAQEIAPPPPRPVAARLAPEVVAEVARAFGLTPEELRSRARTRLHCDARFTAMRVLRWRGNSLPRIARLLGRKDHSAVINGLVRFESHATARMREVADALIDGRGE